MVNPFVRGQDDVGGGRDLLAGALCVPHACGEESVRTGSQSGKEFGKRGGTAPKIMVNTRKSITLTYTFLQLASEL